MRRLLSGLTGYFGELGRATVRGWNAFFFGPADPTPLGLIRVLVGGLAFWSLLVYGLDLRDYLGSTGWADPEAVAFVKGYRTLSLWSFWFAVPDALLRPVWGLCLVVLGMFTVGLFSRTTAVLTWIILVSTIRRAPVSLYGFDQVLSTWALYLAVTGASGQAVSLDRFLDRWRRSRASWARRRHDGKVAFESGAPAPSVSANLGLRLIQLHLCLIYGMAGLAKLQGAAWWEGRAVWGTIAAGEFRLFDLTWLVAFPWLLNAATHASLFLEIGFPVFVWVKVLRPLLIGAVVVLHLGVELTLGLGEFGLAMIAGNLAFTSGPWLRSLATGRDPTRPGVRVLYDGACPKCRASMAFLSAADPDRVLQPIDLTAVDVSTVAPSLTSEACLRAMHAVRDDGRVFAGFDAVVAIARRLPLFWPLAFMGSIPGVTQAGRHVYNRVAAGRSRDVPCTDETCSIHPPKVEKTAVRR